MTFHHFYNKYFPKYKYLPYIIQFSISFENKYPAKHWLHCLSVKEPLKSGVLVLLNQSATNCLNHSLTVKDLCTTVMSLSLNKPIDLSPCHISKDKVSQSSHSTYFGLTLLSVLKLREEMISQDSYPECTRHFFQSDSSAPSALGTLAPTNSLHKSHYKHRGQHHSAYSAFEEI